MSNKIEPNNMNWTKGKVEGFLGKDLLSLDSGTIKIVKVLPLSGYPEHLHPDKTEYAYVLDGMPEFTIDTETYKGKAGEFFIFPTNTIHSIKNNTDMECLILVGSLRN